MNKSNAFILWKLPFSMSSFVPSSEKQGVYFDGYKDVLKNLIYNCLQQTSENFSAG